MGDVFDKVGTAKPGSGGVNPEAGVYPVLYIDALKTFTSDKDRKEWFVAEIDILESNVESRPAGTKMSWTQNLSDWLSAPGNVRAMIAAVAGKSVDETGPAECRAACSEENPHHGRLVRMEATNIITKVKKENFTKCVFTALPETYQQHAETLHQEAGFSPI